MHHRQGSMPGCGEAGHDQESGAVQRPQGAQAADRSTALGFKCAAADGAQRVLLSVSARLRGAEDRVSRPQARTYSVAMAGSRRSQQQGQSQHQAREEHDWLCWREMDRCARVRRLQRLCSDQAARAPRDFGVQSDGKVRARSSHPNPSQEPVSRRASHRQLHR